MNRGDEGTDAAAPSGRPGWLRYGAAVALTIAMLVVAHELAGPLGAHEHHPYLVAWITVIAAAYFGGVGPGLVATLLSAAILAYYWVEPTRSFRVGAPVDAVTLALYVLCGVTVSILIERLHRARAEERRLRRSREIVLGIVAHDLRNPLNAIVAAASVLRHKPDDGRPLAVIERAARRMDHLIGDLVDASALDNDGTLSVVVAQETVAHLVGDAVGTVSADAAAKGIAVATDLGPELRVHCDRERMLQVLGNLLCNAVKFTPEGGRITVRAVSFESFVRVEVTDTGPGIKPHLQSAIFERNWTGGLKGSGAGLGLFIARGIVRAHGGRLWLHSEPGHGTTFFFTIPAAVHAATARAARRSSRLRVL